MPIRENAYVVYELTKAEFKKRNESSLLGVLWYLLGPLLTFGVLYVVFTDRLGSGVERYSLYLFSGIVVWNFFGSATAHALSAVQMRAGIIKSLPVRRDIIILSVVLDLFVSHLFELAVLLLLVLASGALAWTAVFFPLILLLQFVFVLGVSKALAALFCVFGDLDQIWSVVMKAWWFATPIFYVLTPDGPGRRVSMWNPLFHAIDLSRDVLVYGTVPDIRSLAIFAVFALVAYAAGSRIFAAISPRFAEYV